MGDYVKKDVKIKRNNVPPLKAQYLKHGLNQISIEMAVEMVKKVMIITKHKNVLLRKKKKLIEKVSDSYNIKIRILERDIKDLQQAAVKLTNKKMYAKLVSQIRANRVGQPTVEEKKRKITMEDEALKESDIGLEPVYPKEYIPEETEEVKELMDKIMEDDEPKEE